MVLEQSEDNSGAEGGAAAAACASAVEPLRFHDNHGRNVILSEAGARARRGESYNQGVVLSNRYLFTFATAYNACNFDTLSAF